MVMFLAIKNSALLGKECIVASKQIYIHKSLLHQIKVIFRNAQRAK